MRLLPNVVLILILTSAAAHAETITGRASAIDADTLELHGERIRLLDIDAPESRQFWRRPGSAGVSPFLWSCGSIAANKLSLFIGARPVTCETTKKDRYGRHLARCTVGGEDIALWLAESGWVFPYRDCKCELIRLAVDRARAQQLGIWSGDVQEPWEWRKAN